MYIYVSIIRCVRGSIANWELKSRIVLFSYCSWVVKTDRLEIAWAWKKVIVFIEFRIQKYNSSELFRKWKKGCQWLLPIATRIHNQYSYIPYVTSRAITTLKPRITETNSQISFSDSFAWCPRRESKIEK